MNTQALQYKVHCTKHSRHIGDCLECSLDFLTKSERMLFDMLFNKVKEVVAKEDLVNALAANSKRLVHARYSNTLEVLMGRVRRTLPMIKITTIRGRGYRLEQESSVQRYIDERSTLAAVETVGCGDEGRGPRTATGVLDAGHVLADEQSPHRSDRTSEGAHAEGSE
jgi:hypothetical protein